MITFSGLKADTTRTRHIRGLPPVSVIHLVDYETPASRSRKEGRGVQLIVEVVWKTFLISARTRCNNQDQVGDDELINQTLDSGIGARVLS